MADLTVNKNTAANAPSFHEENPQLAQPHNPYSSSAPPSPDQIALDVVNHAFGAPLQPATTVEVTIGGQTANNPFGHAAIVIDNKVYSFGTNYTNGGQDQDWGGDATKFLAAQSGARETDVLTLNISPQQAQDLQNYLTSHDPNAPGARPYDILANSCVTQVEDSLAQAGIVTEPMIFVPSDGSSPGYVPDPPLTPSGLESQLDGTPGLVQKTEQVGTPGSWDPFKINNLPDGAPPYAFITP